MLNKGENRAYLVAGSINKTFDANTFQLSLGWRF